jgi:transcriptional regulator with XRE-family HTH domain
LSLQISEKFAEKVVSVLLSARLKAGISQNQLSKLSGLSRGSIQHLESGRRLPNLVTLHSLAEALGVPTWKVLKEAEELLKNEK